MKLVWKTLDMRTSQKIDFLRLMFLSFNNDENTEIQDEDPEAIENITGGQWYSDVQGSWHYKSICKDLIGAHVVDNQHVYFHAAMVNKLKGESVQRNNHYYFYDQNLGA